MKKSILLSLAAVAALSLTAFAYINWSSPVPLQKSISCNKSVGDYTNFVNYVSLKPVPELLYRVRNRWTSITKEEILKTKSILGVLNHDNNYTRTDYRNVRLSVLHNDKDVRDIKKFEMGQSEFLNPAQLKLLFSCDYSTNFRLTALNKRMDKRTGDVREDSLVQYFTVIPEKEAVFSGGDIALIKYLKESSKDLTAIIQQDKLQPGKLFFTVTKNGTIENVKIVDTSGYPSIDDELARILKEMPREWDPAENSKGEKVDQELVFFFGAAGC